jgi:polyisoprenoid-binding protein YceI
VGDRRRADPPDVEHHPHLPPGAWRVDPARSAIRFSVRHFGVAKVTGSLRLKNARLVGTRVLGEVDVASVDTGEPVRDERLRKEFFDAERFPRMHFEGTWTPDGPVVGALTIRDVTRTVTLATDATPLPDGAVRLRGRGELSRRAFGLSWDALVDRGRVLVGDRVTIDADVVAVRSRRPRASGRARPRRRRRAPARPAP